VLALLPQELVAHGELAELGLEAGDPLVAVVGRPPAVAYAPAPSGEVAAGPLPLDLAFADRGGALRVSVIQDGKPLPGAWVGLLSTSRLAGKRL
jgi:hypothetical protein